MYTINLKNVNKEMIEIVGGKAANLGELINANIPVPKGFCITSNAYDYYSKQMLESEIMPKDLLSEILDCYHQMGDNVRVAVRSSATLEDLNEASFAGQQETYLNVFGETKLIDAVEDCFASLWNERATDYRNNSGFGNCHASIAVVVQEMVESDISGVMFTANPVSNNIGEILINASYGLGEAIVSGKVSPDIFIISKEQNEILRKTIGSKELSIVYRNESSTTEVINSDRAKSAFCLSDEKALQLSLIGKQIEEHFGNPQDIEWAIKDGLIKVLQARAITTLESENHLIKQLSEKEEDFLQIAREFYPELPYSLEFTPINLTMQIAFGFEEGHDTIHLDEEGELIINLPEEKFELTEDIHFDEKNSNNFNENIHFTATAFDKTRKLLQEVEKLDLMKQSISALTQKFEALVKEVSRTLDVRFNYNINYGFAVGTKIKKIFEKNSLKYSEYDLLSNLSYRTNDMNIELQLLIDIINNDQQLKEKFNALKSYEFTGEKFDCLCEENAHFKRQYSSLMQNYGWKSTNSHKSFSASSWKEDKTRLAELLKITLQGKNRFVCDDKYDNICKEVEAVLPKNEALKLFNLFEEFRQYHKNREESVYILENIYGICRMLLRAISFKLPVAFKNYSDVLYLRMNEVLALDDDCEQSVIKDKIDIRKQKDDKNKLLWNGSEMPVSYSNTTFLMGEGGSFGKISGEVCIINDVSEFSKLKPNQILVCKYTDPIWTPLFRVASAVIAETGSSLSHAAIVAREYGIPVVMSCASATTILKDGQRIIVDGLSGKVELILLNEGDSQPALR